MEYVNAYKHDNMSKDTWVCVDEAISTEASIDRSGKETKYVLEGIAMKGNVINGNKRKYPLDKLIIRCEDYQEEIKAGRAVGEMKHPGRPDIDPERIAIKINKLERDGTTENFVHVSEALPYGLGLIVRGHMDHGIQIATSSRCMGKLTNKPDFILVEDFKIVTAADVVWNPSVSDAIPTYIKEDIMNYIFENVDMMESIYNINIIESSKGKLNKAMKNNIKSTINSIYEELLNMKF
jgi:hypothetical protein